VDFQRFMSIASFSNPSIWAEPFSRDLVDSQNKLTFGRRVFSDRTLIPLSQAVGSGGRVHSSLRLFWPSHPSVRPPGSTEVDRTSADS
jgi:hypothetical protein